MIGKTNNTDSDTKSISERFKTSLPKIRKLLNSASVLALLLPNLMSVGVATAEELTPEDPPTEGVSTLDEEETETTSEETSTPEESTEQNALSEEPVDEEITPDTPEVSETPKEYVTPETPEEENTPDTPDEPVTSEVPVDEPDTAPIAETVQTVEEEPIATEDEIAPFQVLPGINQENLVYENGILTLQNQIEGTNIAAVLPNGSLIYATVPFHGRWSPRQSIARHKVYPGDTLEFFTYDGNVRGESTFLTVEGEGESRPADQQQIRYGWQQFSYRPTVRDTRIGYKTEPFFTVEMTFPHGNTYTQVANSLGQTWFNFPDWYTPIPGQVFTAQVYDRNGDLLDLDNPDLFRNLTTPNQSEISVHGEIPPAPVTNTVTIDPNGGTINDGFAITEVEDGETFTVPYTFQSGLARSGYTLTGYSVEGTLLDSSSNPVTELSRYTGTYTPTSDVTLTANWEVTAGDFVLQDSTPNFRTGTRSFVLTDGENEYPLTSSSSTSSYREWRAQNVPNGEYTLLINGVPYANELLFTKVGHPDTESTVTINNDVPTFDLTFEDGSSSTFIRYRVNLNEYGLGVEVRDLNNSSTDEVEILVENEAGQTFAGSYNQYNQWTSTNDLPAGTYTITLTTPEGTYAEVNPTVASQVAQPTEEENIFTIEVNAESQGNLSRVFGAFRLAEVPNTYPLGIEVRGLDGRRTEDVTVWVQNDEFTVFEGSFNEYSQWLSDEELPEGTYTITLDTPKNTYAVINDSTRQFAQPTDRQNVFTIELNDENQGSLSRIYGAFQLEEMTAPIGVEVRGLDGRRTEDVTVWVQNDEFTVFEGSFNEYSQWLTDEELPVGEYTITLVTPENTYAVINESTTNHAVPTDRQNVFTIEVNEENLGTMSAVYGAFQLEEMSFTLGVEVRGLNGRRTEDVTVWVQNEDFTVFNGSYNEYSQWLTEEELPAGEYTITLDTPENTYAVVNETTSQYAVPTDRQNVFTIELNETNLGTSSEIYGAFQLVEMEYRLGVEVRGLDGRRTTDVDVTVTNADDEVFAGSYNEYAQWLTEQELPAGQYTITLNTPEGTVAVINETTSQYAVPTDEENVFTIELNEANLGTSSAIYGAFRLEVVPAPVETHPLGIEVRGLNGRRTNEVGIVVTDADGTVFEGSYDQWNLWTSTNELPVGTYTITLTTPQGTVAVVNETVATQAAEATDTPNVFTIDVNTVNRGNLSRVFGAFVLEEVPAPAEAYPLGLEIRGLNDRRTTDVDVVVTDADGNVFEGSYNDALQWVSNEDLPVGTYTITLTTPEGTVAVINETVTTQAAEATDTPNVFTIDVSLENRGNLSRVFGAFVLEEIPAPVEAYPLGLEIRGLNDRRTTDVDVVVTDADGNVFEGSYNAALQWVSNEDLPVGTYTITLTMPEGTVAIINETVTTQAAEATDTPNVFTIDVNLENRGALSRVFGAFILVEVDEPVDPDPEEPVDPAPIDPETPEDDDNDTEDPTSPVTPVDDQDDDEDDLPETGIAPSTIGLGITTLLSGLGLAFIEKKRRK